MLPTVKFSSKFVYNFPVNLHTDKLDWSHYPPPVAENSRLYTPDVMWTYDFPRRIDGVDGEVHERVGEAFVEPKIVPPRHRHHVAEPLRAAQQVLGSRDIYYV